TKDTQGFYLKEIVGTELRNVTAMRYGGQIGDDTYYRVWGKYTDHDSFGPTGDDHNFDDWRIGHSGFRVDHEGVEDTTVTLQGEAFYSDQMGEQFSIPNSMPFSTTRVRGDNRGEGGHLLTRVKRRHPGGSGWSVTGYVDYFGFKSLDDHEVDLLTTSLDWRHHLDIGDRQNFIWGAGYRLHYYETEPGASVAFDPPRDEMHLFSAFAQDTITLEPDRWFFMLGSKFEHNDRSGFEIQPSARLWWTPDDRQTVWGSVSRAVRRPSPADEDLNLTLMRTASPPPNDEVEIRGSDIDAENVMAYEMGYRNRLSEEVTFDTAAFLNIYDDLVVLEQRGEDLVIVNGGEAESYGLETSVRWRPASNLSLTGSYSLLLIHAHGPMTDDIEDLAPTHQFHARSDYDVTDNVALHGALYFVDDVGNVPPYWRLDTGITWRVNENVDLSLWGQNLLDNRHPEFESSASASPDATEVERGAYLQLRCRF
ncbi:MAG: TonB-dependent receptor plug domain-containing protein, partial [Phycisphaeraceae bacterium]